MNAAGAQYERTHEILERRCTAIVTRRSRLASFRDQAALDAVTPEIRETKPHVVWCAFGAPKQELWMYRNAAALAPALVLGVGAAFEFYAGTKKRAPVWMQRTGLEWLYRLGSEPRRPSWRYLSTNTLFLLTLLRRIS